MVLNEKSGLPGRITNAIKELKRAGRQRIFQLSAMLGPVDFFYRKSEEVMRWDITRKECAR